MASRSAIKTNNIWVAAGDGDLERVQELIEGGLSPNVPDSNTYTPMHAAASYGHLDVLEYLISKGGSVNVTDEDNETPLFTVESVGVARYLVEKGATPDWKNAEGQTAAESLAEDFPDIATYLLSLTSVPSGTSHANQAPVPQPSEYYTEQASEHLSAELIERAREVMERADREGRDPEQELLQVVGDAVLGGMRAGQEWSQQVTTENSGDDNKRARLDES